MAITLTSQLTDVSLDPGSPTGVGTSNAEASETDIQLQGANCSAMGHSGSVGPTSPSTISQFRGGYASVTSYTRTDMHAHFWMRDLYPIRDVNVGGISAYIFGSSEAIYYATGLDKGYAGGWFHYVLNLDAGDRPAASLGTAPSANITRMGMVGNISVSKGEDFLQNSYFDALRRGTGGQGITMYGGTSGARETFSGCAGADSASYGIFRDVGGAFFIEGPVTWGTATQTTYIRESLQTLNFTNFTVNNSTGGNTIVSAVASDYYRIVLADGTTGVTNIDFEDVTFKGVSRDTPFRFTSNLGTGDAYTSLRTTYVFGETITLNTLCTSDSDTFVECVTIVPGGITLTSPSFSNCDAVTLTATNDLISGGTTALQNTAANTPFITTNSLDKIENHTADNTGGTGHFVEITATGTYDWDGNVTTGYSGTGAAATIYNNSAGLVTINVINGASTPTIRNGTSASTVVNNAVTILTAGVSEGAAVKVIADETVGTITTGDVLDERLANASGIASFNLDYEAAFEPSGLDVIVRARQQGLPNFAISQDNAVYVDQTTAANSGTNTDMTLLITAPVAGQDYYYFGHAEQFNRMKLDISTIGAGTYTVNWEYWNGAWVSLSGVSDGTSAFKTLGENIVSWTLPGDWATTSVNALGPSFYVRAAYVSGTVTTAPLGRKCKLDITRYLPFVQNRTITSSGLTVFAAWTVDSIAKFDDND